MKHIACVGAGYWGKNLIRNFHQLGVLHTICDGDEEVLKRFSEQYPDVKSGQNIEDVLSNKGIDAISIATPAETHYELIKQALNAGKHVYVEKPLCLDEAHARIRAYPNGWTFIMVSPDGVRN